MPSQRRSRSKPRRTFDARADTLDFRDQMFTPSLVEVPSTMPLEDYRKTKPTILDQGQEGACTGFGLAAVCNHLLQTRTSVRDTTKVSPTMFYQMAKRYDEWSGEDYDGSSIRGALKGWHKHGVCAATLWRPSDPHRLTAKRAEDAAARPLGAYFRVNHRDLTAIHVALAEVGILLASAMVHGGWDSVGKTGVIERQKRILGGHAFALVGYDDEGFWVQNSWGRTWGKGGFGHLSYADWLDNGMDIWVARLGVPVKVDIEGVAKLGKAGALTGKVSTVTLRPHVVTLGNDGELRTSGRFGNDAEDVADIIKRQLPEITSDWRRKRILLYAHGGLVGERNALQRVENYLPALLDAQVYPLAFIWRTDFWSTIKNILKDAFGKRRSEGALDSAKDFILDRIDDTLEPLARLLSGKAQWDEMKENGVRATTRETGGARLVADLLAELIAEDPKIELHVAGHSAGSIFHAPLIQYLATEGNIASGPMRGEEGLGIPIETVSLWAPACTTKLFKRSYLELIEQKRIRNFALFNLKNAAEKDDHCAHIYNKSLLYLVSNAFESKPRIPLFRDGVPLLGMNKFVKKDRKLQALLRKRHVDYVLAPNEEKEGTRGASRARSHGGFDDDPATVKATLARILGRKEARASFSFPRSSSSARDLRKRMS